MPAGPFFPFLLLALLAAGCGSGVADDEHSDGGSADLPVVTDAADAHASSPGGDAVSAPPPVPPRPVDALPLAEQHRRADLALQSLLLRYWRGADRYFASAAAPGSKPTQYWTFAQAFDAVLDGVERTGGERYAGWVQTLYEAQNARGWSRDFYDDENWMALVLLRAHDLTGRRAYLDRAVALFADIMRAWDTSCCFDDDPGGLWWDRKHTQKATAANAGAALTGARLYARTRDAKYLRFAEKAYAYWRKHMVDAATGQVADHVEPDGTVVKWKFTYNEGAMIGAAVELHGATRDGRYRDDALKYADFMVRHETVSTSVGTALFDGTADRCTGDCAQFKGIGFRFLTALRELGTMDARYLDVLRGSAEAIWTLARDASAPSGMLFAIDWRGPATKSASIDQQSSAVMALNVYAGMLGKAPPTLAWNEIEAEEATLHGGLGLEASHRGFEGWGYVAGWHESGESIDFPVRAPAAGDYVLEFRYAAGAGDARRSVVVGNGGARALRFASTGAWEKYRTVALSHRLVAGMNTVSLRLDGARGDANWLNVDRLVVKAR